MLLRQYLPSVVSIFLGLVFLRLQALAVAIVVVGCIGFGIFHAICVSEAIQGELEEKRKAPTLRQVTVRLAKKMKLLD